MRIRIYKPQDIEAVFAIAQQASEEDGTTPPDLTEFVAWFADPDLDATENAFVMTDDDDELQTWSQAGTLEGMEGEIVGYTFLSLQQDHMGYHFLCQGVVHPAFRHQHAGSVLFVGALNRARLLALEFDFEAEEAGLLITFSALLPSADPASARLAARNEMELVAGVVLPGLQLYRRTL